MKIEVLTLFPEIFTGFRDSSMIAKALKAEALQLNFTNIRDYSKDKHHKVDDYPYGGFAGMVMQAEPLYDAINAVLEDGPAPVIYFSPQGRVLSQEILEDYSQKDKLILLCGHYK
ncbi:MAG TPA: tRNA (guanosine(37)-N1)-methyltransferase TrmD, partial [Candidatus Cloacimonadota bacterium]|nr:tRNA (guanosine(37)-N1)-methyltransferase TrmD [Candidatus Cloacimonadota bacterium]